MMFPLVHGVMAAGADGGELVSLYESDFSADPGLQGGGYQCTTINYESNNQRIFCLWSREIEQGTIRYFALPTTYQAYAPKLKINLLQGITNIDEFAFSKAGIALSDGSGSFIKAEYSNDTDNDPDPNSPDVYRGAWRVVANSGGANVTGEWVRTPGGDGVVYSVGVSIDSGTKEAILEFDNIEFNRVAFGVPLNRQWKQIEFPSPGGTSSDEGCSNTPVYMYINDLEFLGVLGPSFDDTYLQPNTQYVLSNMNLTATSGGSSARGCCVANTSRGAGKYYFEIEVVDPGLGSNTNAVGIVPSQEQASIDNGGIVGGTSGMGVGYMYNGGLYNRGSYNSGYGEFFVAGSVVGVLCDFDAGEIRFSKDGDLQPVISFDFSTDGGNWLPAFNTSYDGNTSTASVHNARFTPEDLEHLPSGYKAWAEPES